MKRFINKLRKAIGLKPRGQRKMMEQLGLAYYLELRENKYFQRYVDNSNPRLKRRTRNILKKYS